MPRWVWCPGGRDLRGHNTSASVMFSRHETQAALLPGMWENGVSSRLGMQVDRYSGGHMSGQV